MKNKFHRYSCSYAASRWSNRFHSGLLLAAHRSVSAVVQRGYWRLLSPQGELPNRLNPAEEHVEVICSVLRYFNKAKWNVLIASSRLLLKPILNGLHYVHMQYRISLFFQASKSQFNSCKWNCIDWKPGNIQKKWVWFCHKWKWWVWARTAGSKKQFNLIYYAKIPFGSYQKVWHNNMHSSIWFVRFL